MSLAQKPDFCKSTDQILKCWVTVPTISPKYREGLMDIERMQIEYRKWRKHVFFDATRPISGDSSTHTRNQELFCSKVVGICDAADPMHYLDSSPKTVQKLWRHLWTKIRYAGIRSQIASKEIDDIEIEFDEYKQFGSKKWDLDSKGYKITRCGTYASDFLNRTGKFSKMQTVGNIPKLKRTIELARAFDAYFSKSNRPAIEFVTSGLDCSDVWKVHDNLLKQGYGGDLTALHLMMDLGFEVIKPDVVLSRIFLEFGWLSSFNDLPATLTRDDLQGRGKHGAKYLYTKPIIYKKVIDVARQIIEGISVADLKSDIGWVTNNKLREFDIFMVKAGQLPENTFGIERQLIASPRGYRSSRKCT